MKFNFLPEHFGLKIDDMSLSSIPYPVTRGTFDEGVKVTQSKMSSDHDDEALDAQIAAPWIDGSVDRVISRSNKPWLVD